MTDAEFDLHVSKIQARYGSRPLALRTRIAFWVMIGYAGFVAALVTVLGVSAALLVIAFVAGTTPSVVLMAIVAVLLTFGVAQTLIFLWVPLETRTERAVTADEVPKLFALLRMFQSEFETRPFDSVQVTPDFNASVQILPRWGVFGGNRSHLYLGLPLMNALTTEQFAAVLAHEFAHASSRHDRFGMWIYRLRQTWSRVFAEIHSAKTGTFLSAFRGIVMWFIDWYWPRFNALAFVLSRANEYQADRLSADWGGATPMAQALWKIECLSRRLNDSFWDEIQQLAKSSEDIPHDVIAKMTAFLSKEPSDHDASRWIEQSRNVATNSTDTHPCVSERLSALGMDVETFASEDFPLVPTEASAKVLLASALPDIEADVNGLWSKENRLRWKSVFHNAKRLEKKIAGSIATDESTSLSAEQQWEHARTVGQLHGHKAAEPLLRRLLSQFPNHGPANVALGAGLLSLGFDEGVVFLRRVLDDPENMMTPSAGEFLCSHYQQVGQTDKVKEVREIVDRFQKVQEAAAKERSSVTATDKLVAHGLSENEISQLRKMLTAQPTLDSAWLARKELQIFPNQRLFILVVRTHPKGLFGKSNPDADRQLVTSLISSVSLPGRVVIISPQGGFTRLARKVMAMDGADVT